MSDEKILRLEKRCAREKKARLAAEEVLEEKSRELHDKNETLRRFSDDLEMQVAERTIELKEARDEAFAAAAAKSEFLANMSHELRTPMNGVLGMLKILEGTQLNDDQQDLLRIARSSGELLLSVINDVLDFSKIDADKMELENLPFRPERLLEEVVEPMVFTASEKGVSLLYSADENLPPALSGDPTRIKQVITNLVSNAIKFTDDGIVNVTMEIMEEDWLIRVRDTGVGMSQRQLDNIFEAFNQGDSSITRTHGGTGLGLTIINRLADMMGGDIRVTSQVGKGSEFCVRLPVIEADVALVEDVTKCDSENIYFKNQRVLLVEDNKVNQQIAISLLSDIGLNITVAENGLEALQKLQFNNFDLVLMDLQMPVMGGVEATLKIRALDKDYADIPIIAMTAHAGREHIDECLTAGMNVHTTKPIDLDELVHILTQWLEFGNVKSVADEQVAEEQVPDSIDGVELGHALALGFKSYNLQSCVQLRSEQGAKTYSTHGAASALEDELLNRMSAIDERIIEQGKRMILNYESVSVLVRNMPVEDDVRCGELRDHTLMMVEDAHSLNLKVSKEQQLSTNRNSMIRQALEQSREVLVEIETIQKQHKSRNIKVMDELFADIQVSFFSMGLTEDQEEQLTSIIQEKLAKAMELEDEAQQLDDMLRGLTEQLDMLAKNS
jgi:two-component system sensor histidine kinase/response regulator